MIILALGALMLLDSHGGWPAHSIRFFPGIVLILIGTVRLLWGDDNCRGRRSSFGGFWLVFVGIWLIANQSHIYGMTFRHSWPILIVAWGVIIVARELFGHDDRNATPDVSLPAERR